MARPKGRQLPNRVSVALTDDQLAALERLALGNQAGVSWVIRRAVSEYLERNPTAELTDNSELSPSPARSE